MNKQYEDNVKSLQNKDVKKIAKKFFKTTLMKQSECGDKEEYESQFSEFKLVLLSKITLQTFLDNTYIEETEDDVFMKNYLQAYDFILNKED